MIKQIIETIKGSVEPIMKKWSEDRANFIIEAKKKADAEYRALNVRDEWKRFRIEQSHGLNKTSLNWLFYGNDHVKKQCQKDAEHAMKKIDVAVTKKLKNVDVKSVELIRLDMGKDGYVEGAWKLDNGQVFSFETIYAGGYNIQCLHVRTLYRLN